MYNHCMTKICGGCKTEKSLDNFTWRNKAKGWKAAWCKICVKEYDAKRTMMEGYSSKRKNAIQARHATNIEYILGYLRINPCIDCGIKDFRVLQFDHRDGVIKRNNISHMIRSCSLKTIKEEIAKCDVRCANCHQIRTAEQFGTWRSNPDLQSSP
jgi:hypothetical protein